MKRVSKLIAAILLGLCLVAALAACGKSKEPETEETTNDVSLTGTWSESIFDSGYQFNTDGTGMDTFWQLGFTYTADGQTLTITYDDEIWGVATYTYTVADNTLTMTSDEGVSTEYQKAS